MEAQKLVCNDCGCRFEIREGKEPLLKANKENKPAPLSCPKCRSFNVIDITTA
jgi:hypothetical protein